jgi:alpha-L-fucosidase 2
LGFIIILFFLTSALTNGQDILSGLKIWFTRPADNWNEALPVGNGRLCAMVFGGIEKER